MYRNAANNLLKRQEALKCILAHHSTKPVVQSAEDASDRHIKQYENLTKIVKKTRTKKPQRQPFAKNLFLGEYDTEILTYPQLQKEDTDQLEGTVEQIKTAVNPQINAHKNFDGNLLQNLADYRLIGLQRSSFDNGLECNVSEQLRLLEALSVNRARYQILHNEQLGLQTLIQYAGDNNNNKKIIDELASGRKSVSYCMAEEKMDSLVNMATTATLSKDKSSWSLNGEKHWVVNGLNSDYYIVFALTEVVQRDTLKFPKLTAFLVGKESGGITTESYNIRDMEVAKVRFQNTPVPRENVIGEAGGGEKMLSAITSDFRLSCGAPCIALSRQLIDNLRRHIVDETTGDNVLLKTDAVRKRLGEMAIKLHVMESMVYLTSGLKDSYEDQDCELESAIVRYYCSTRTHEIAAACLSFVGARALQEDHWSGELFRESLKYVTLHESNDNLKILIALMGLKHAGDFLNDKIRMVRNPLFHYQEVFKNMWNLRKDYEDRPSMTLGLHHHLHPSLQTAANNLEYGVHRLKFGAETVLMHHGADVVNMHMDLDRIADVVVDVYAMTAALARASRAYCIGLQHSDFEMLMASAFSNYAHERVKYNVGKIYGGRCQTNDENLRVVAKRLVKFKGYFPSHPLARNF